MKNVSIILSVGEKDEMSISNITTEFNYKHMMEFDALYRRTV